MNSNYNRFKNLLFITLFISFQSHAQWIPVESGTTEQLWDVHFVNGTLGRAVGSNTILKTIDGGITWEPENNIPDTNYYGIHVKNELEAWAVGKKKTSSTAGRIHYTTDGGETWLAYITGTINKPWWSIDFADDGLHGAIVGQEGQMLYTNNGGTSWFKRTSPAGDAGIIRDITFYDGLNGIAVGYSSPSVGFIIKTTDGGNTWANVVNTVGGLYSVSFIDANIGLAVGSQGKIFRTTDGGNTWGSVFTGVNTLNGVHFYDNDRAFAVGNAGDIFVTADGGESWEPQDSGTTYTLRSVFKNNNETTYAVGVLGTILNGCSGDGKIKFSDDDDVPDNINITEPFMITETNLDSQSIKIAYTESDAYIYFYVEETCDLPKVGDKFKESISFDGKFFPLEVSYLGKKILQFRLDLSQVQDEGLLNFSIPNTITDGDNIIEFDSESRPQDFSIQIKKNGKSQSIDVFGNASLGAGFSLGQSILGLELSLAKVSVQGSLGMGLKFTKNSDGEQYIQRRIEASASSKLTAPEIETSKFTGPNNKLEASGEVSGGVNGIASQSIKFDTSLSSSAINKLKAAYLMEPIILAGIQVSPFTFVIFKALSLDVKDLYPSSVEAYRDYIWTDGSGFGTDFSNTANIGAEANFVGNKIKLNVLSGGRSGAMSYLKESNVKNGNTDYTVEFAQQVDFSSGLNIESAGSSEINFGDFLEYKNGSKVALKLTKDSNNVPNKLEVSFDGFQSGQIAFGTFNFKDAYSFTLPENIVKNSDISSSLAAKFIALSRENELDNYVDLSVSEFQKSLPELFEKSPDRLIEFQDHTILETKRTKMIGAEYGIGIDLSNVLGKGRGISFGFQVKQLDEREFVKEKQLVSDGEVIPMTKYNGESQSNPIFNLENELNGILSGLELILKDYINSLVVTIETSIEIGQEFLIDVKDLLDESKATISGNISKGSRIITRYFESVLKSGANSNKISQNKSKTLFTKSNRVITKNNSTGKIFEGTTSTTLYIVSDFLNISVLDETDEVLTQFDPVTLTMTIDQSIIDSLGFGNIEKQLAKIYQFNSEILSWEELADDIDLEIDKVAGQINKSETYAVGILYDTTSDVSAPIIDDYFPKEGNVIPASEKFYATLVEPVTGVGLDLSQTIIKIDGLEVDALWDPIKNKILYTPETPLANGNHTFEVIVKDLNGNTNSIFLNFVVDSTLSIEIIEDLDLFKIYPNPTKGIIYIKGNVSILKTVSLYNTMGQHIMDVNGNLQEVDINNLNTGLYYLKLNTEEGTRIIKILKE